jgi:large subunit ribosomal protein L30
MVLYAVVRVRGTINIKPDIRKTLELLNLTRSNHCVLLPDNPVTKGMLQKIKDYVTWGEIDTSTLTTLLQTRGRLVGDAALTDTHIASATSYKTIDTLSEALHDEKVALKELPDVKPLFRLSPPKKGFEGIKRSYRNNGALGYRGANINTLIQKML